jgi:hypothetical protein
MSQVDMWVVSFAGLGWMPGARRGHRGAAGLLDDADELAADRADRSSADLTAVKNQLPAS